MSSQSLTGLASSGRIRPAADLLLEREAEATTLESGPWSLSLRGGELDDVSFEGVLIVRSIRLVVRDENWGTLPMRLEATGSAPGFAPAGEGHKLTLRGSAGQVDGVCTWTLSLRIDGSALRVDARVEATRRFRRNRLGLVVLHPPALAGRSLAVEHSDGSTTQIVLPEHIAPHQPALDIRALSWRTHPTAGNTERAVDSVLRFSGDVFEMEDQRNWSDASFKTYSTPLSMPFPIEIQPGFIIEQSVELRCTPSPSEQHASDGRHKEEPVRVHVAVDRTAAPVKFPVLTTSVSSGPVAGSPVPAPFGPLICELDPNLPIWRDILDRAATESGGRPLDLRLIVERGEEVIPVLDRLLDAGIQTARIGVFDRRTHVSEPELLTDLRKRMDASGISGELIGGTGAHFTELNRNSSRLEGWEGPLSFSITPFMHDRGGHQLVESIVTQRIVARDAVDIAHGRPLHIGPVTLGARFNAVATSAPPSPRSGTVDEGFGAESVDGATDPRQNATSLGAWVLASISALAIPGVTSLSYFERSGARGLIDAHGGATAAATVLETMAQFTGGPVVPIAADHPAIIGLAVARDRDGLSGGFSVAIVGNLSDGPLVVAIDGVEDFTLDSGSVRSVSLRAT